MRSRICLTLADANTIVAAAKAHATAKKWPVAIVVLDEAGVPLHIERMDGAPLKAVEIATMKARTSFQLGRPSADMEEGVKNRISLLGLPDVALLQGALPIKIKGDCVGAVGVSGVMSYEDEEVSRAGIAALKLD